MLRHPQLRLWQHRHRRRDLRRPARRAAAPCGVLPLRPGRGGLSPGRSRLRPRATPPRPRRCPLSPWPARVRRCGCPARPVPARARGQGGVPRPWREPSRSRPDRAPASKAPRRHPASTGLHRPCRLRAAPSAGRDRRAAARQLRAECSAPPCGARARSHRPGGPPVPRALPPALRPRYVAPSAPRPQPSAFR